MADANGSDDVALEGRAALLDYNQICLNALDVHENEVYAMVHTKLTAAEDSEVVRTSYQNLLEEVSDLIFVSTMAVQDDNTSLQGLGADLPLLSEPAKENLEQQVQMWWQNTAEKLDHQIADHTTATGKAFLEHLGIALAEGDPVAEPEVGELLTPLQQAAEQFIQTDLKTCASTAGTEHMRATLRDGSNAVVLRLEAAVNTAVEEAKEWWSDERIRNAAERQRASTEVAALTAPASQDAITAVCDTIRPMARCSPTPLPTPEAFGISPATRGDADSGSLTSPLLARVREGTRLLEADLQVLASDAAGLKKVLERCGEVLTQVESTGNFQHGGNTEQPASATSSAVRLASTRAELQRLIKDAKFEEAFDQALRWDGQTQVQLLTEHLCDQVLEVTGSRTPEEFLTAGDSHRLPSDRLRLLLMAKLCQRISAEETSVQQAGSNLEWVLCLQGQLELIPSVLESFALVAGTMLDCLTDVSRGRSPPSLVVAVAEDRQRMATHARLALKQLKMLQRRSAAMRHG